MRANPRILLVLLLEAALLSAWLSSALSPGGEAAIVNTPTAPPSQALDVEFTAAQADVIQAVYLLLLEDEDPQLFLPNIRR